MLASVMTKPCFALVYATLLVSARPSISAQALTGVNPRENMSIDVAEQNSLSPQKQLRFNQSVFHPWTEPDSTQHCCYWMNYITTFVQRITFLARHYNGNYKHNFGESLVNLHKLENFYKIQLN